MNDNNSYGLAINGGYGGLIAIGASGLPVFPFNSEGMRRA